MSTNDYTLILKHLEKLEGKIDGLSAELQQTNLEMTRIAGMKHALSDIKIWKENMESIVNAEDLKEMKKALAEIKSATEDMDKVEVDIEKIKKEKEIDRKEIENLKMFNTKIVTIGTITVFLFSIAMTVLGWYLS